MPKVTVGGKTKHYAYTPNGRQAAAKARAAAKKKPAKGKK